MIERPSLLALALLLPTLMNNELMTSGNNTKSRDPTLITVHKAGDGRADNTEQGGMKCFRASILFQMSCLDMNSMSPCCCCWCCYDASGLVASQLDGARPNRSWALLAFVHSSPHLTPHAGPPSAEQQNEASRRALDPTTHIVGHD